MVANWREYGTAREYLKQAYRLNELMENKIKMVDNLRRLSVSITPNQCAGGSGGGGDAKLAGIVAKIVDLSDQLNDITDSYVDLQREIMGKISAINNKDYRLILEKRYLLFMTWERIAEDMSYTTQWIHVLHIKALKEFNHLIVIDY